LFGVICGARNSCFFDKVIFAMLVTTLTSGQFWKRASLGGLNESGVCDFVLYLECGGGTLALRNLDDASKDYSAEFAGIVASLPVISFHYVTVYVSGCDGQVSIGLSSEPRRIPVSTLTIEIRNTGYSVNTRRNWKQEELSSYFCELRSATTVTYPLATMRVSSAYRLTRKDVSLTGIGTFLAGNTPRDSTPGNSN
jgi:hypothetical protein